MPGAIVAAKHTNAQAKARELIIIFVNFVFMVIVSFCLVLLCWPSLIPIMASQFLPFTEVQNGNHREVTLEVTAATAGSSYGAGFSTTRTDDTPVLLIIWRSVILDGCRGIELEPGRHRSRVGRYETCWRDSSIEQRPVAGVADSSCRCRRPRLQVCS